MKRSITTQIKSLLSRGPVVRLVAALSRGGLLAVAASEAVGIVGAGTFSTDFNSGQPPGTTVYDTAFVDTSGGVGGSGVLKLTTANNDQQGWLVLDDLDGGAVITGFTATFKLLIGGGSVADGFSFSFANDLFDHVVSGEEGAGTGLTVEFDTYDNGSGEGPAIDIKAGGVEIATTTGNLDLFRTGDFVDVAMSLGADGKLNLTVNGTAVYSGLFVPLLPSPGRFALGARTGGLNDNHWVDNLSITTTTQLPAGPTVRSVTPYGTNGQVNAGIAISLLDGRTAKLKPASVKLKLNGTAVTPTQSSSGGVITLSYQPTQLLPVGSNSLVLAYTDTAGRSSSFASSFQIVPYVGPSGNMYAVVLVPSHITWPDAKAAAEQRTLLGHHGHLATITTAEEDLYLENLRSTSPPAGGNRQLWVGGYQDPIDSPPGDNWHWVNNEGPISGYNGGPTYANWLGGEPNDYNGWATENYLTIGLNNQFGWNDQGSYDSTLDGYAVEYEADTPLVVVNPGPNANKVDLSSDSPISVAILSSPTFDATTVDPTTLTFGKTGIEAVALDSSSKDVNGDGRKDLLVHFKVQKTGILCEDTTALLRGQTRKGWSVSGTTPIQPLHCPPYALSMTAMQDVNKVTDVYLKLTPLLNSCPPPLAITEVELNSRDVLNRTRWSTSAQKVPMSPNPDGSAIANLKCSNLLHFQKLKAQIQVNSCQGHEVELDQKTVVQLRPDVAVSSVDVPGSVQMGTIVNLSALVAELNGDLGTSGRVYLMEGTTVLDQASGFIGPKATVSVVFSTVFTTLGSHQLKVVVADESPADYDLSNNEKDFTIDVTQQPASFYASYNHYIDEYAEDYNWPWYQSGSNYHHVNEESLTESLYIPAVLSFPLTGVIIQTSADGNSIDNFALSNLTEDYSDANYAQAYRHLADGFDFYVYTYNYPWYQTSYAQFSRSAADDVFYSVYHNVYWGDGGGPSATKYGTFLNATSSVGTRFVIQSGSSAYGGSAIIPVYNNSWNYPFDYEDPTTGAYDRGFDRGSSTYGYNSGFVTP